MLTRRCSTPIPLLLLATALTGCDRFRDADETGIAGPAVRIPATTTSEEARDHYLIGRDLMDKLRVPEARRHLLQAVDRDSTFAMAHYELALSEPTNRGFLEHLTRAVDLSETTSDGERLTILALHAGAQLLLRRPLGLELVTVRQARCNGHSGGRRPIRDLRQRDTDIYGAVVAELEVVRD